MRTHCVDCGKQLIGNNAKDVGQCIDCYNYSMADFDDDDDDERGYPDYWECLSCGHSSVKIPSFGGQCPRCLNHMEEAYF